ncbi:type I restriction-modification system subunit M [Salisediminibacterium beveridgei]|uniref:site-specific DNA-methyltransferase (adenine-specific) n=1 Tax=Salisediminibacterium beveridgei TaxID=632773 RepID=A0A1D7QSV6_9BACI|nr:type I restriction-modification system subunit M [Salisediminibacterium beveridgei]AOM82067.1 Type I restriction-modification system, DNA-methyltransferase subunit M [Salisediminibacterium beveridgei]
MSKQTVAQSDINAVLWSAADTFRGKIDSSTYKDYILTMLFIKYISDSYKEHLAEYTEKYNGDEKRINRALSRERFVLEQSASFDYLYEQRHNPEIGEIINKALEKIEDENTGKLRGVFRNIDFNSETVLGRTKERNALLRSLLEDFNEISLKPSDVGREDIIGDSYQYMIEQFASDAGKKGGEFFTPSMLSELIARLVEPKENDRIYDPTCGSGSLLIRVSNQVANKKVAIYGQERNGQTQSLAMMNMYLHGIDDAKIEWGDTLANPLHLENDKLMKFQRIVANPPFSLEKWSMGFANDTSDDKSFVMESSLDPYRRFEWGIPPKSKGDFAFVQHMIHSLSNEGTMVTLLPHGVLFRGNSEKKIRESIIQMNLLDAVIGLPGNLFFGDVSISAVILIFKKNRPRKEVLFIDASGAECFEKGTNQNKLREIDIQRILNAYKEYETLDSFAYKASVDEIIENDYNMNIPRYFESHYNEIRINMKEVKEDIHAIKSKISDLEDKMDKYLEKLGL